MENQSARGFSIPDELANTFAAPLTFSSYAIRIDQCRPDLVAAEYGWKQGKLRIVIDGKTYKRMRGHRGRSRSHIRKLERAKKVTDSK